MIKNNVNVIFIYKCDCLNKDSRTRTYDKTASYFEKFVFNNCLTYCIIDGEFTLKTNINPIPDTYDHIPNFILYRMYNLYKLKSLDCNFISTLKETIKLKFKPVLDAGKTINFYELNDLGDNPCLLKKI